MADIENSHELQEQDHSDNESSKPLNKKVEGMNGNYEKKRKILSMLALMDEPNPLLTALKVSFELRRRADENGPDKDELTKLANTVDEFTMRFLDPLRSSYRKLNKSDDAIDLGQKEVSFELRHRADENGPDKDELTKLANTVDKSTMRPLDPLRSSYRESNKPVASPISLEKIMDDAIDMGQKKFFTHPVVDYQMSCKWYGVYIYETKMSWKWLFLNIWCLFDLVLFPILFAVFYAISKAKKNRKRPYESYKKYFTTPYFVFVRDTLSYLTLLGLHFAVCLAPSTIAFSGIEWTILVFFMGRLLVEGKQIRDLIKVQKQRNKQDKTPAAWRAFKKYISDRWNFLDFLSLIVWFTTFILRVATMATSESVTNNRALVIAGYLYGVNTMFLTLRAFGQVMETLKGVGIIQIAFFNILKDVVLIFGQFLAAIVALSITITKVFMAEKSFISTEQNGRELACSTSGISCWGKMIIHLGWSVLGNSDSDPLKSVDSPSEAIAHLLYAVFLAIGVILLVNMMIALLSNTYQQVKNNSQKEWSFKKAVIIQTYSNYHPIPVPFNLVSNLIIGLRHLRKCQRQERESKTDTKLDLEDLKKKYLAAYGHSFPLTDEKTSLERMFELAKKDRHLLNQIASRTFYALECRQGALPSGLEMWESEGIRVEGCRLVNEKPLNPKRKANGARYRNPFSKDFSYFEVLIEEYGKDRCLGVGVVGKDYKTDDMPGRHNGTVGYLTDAGRIFDAESVPEGRIVEGSLAYPGYLIGCSVKVNMARGGKVPVVFTLNGREITEDEILIDFDPENEPLYPYIGMDNKGIRVLTKMHASENMDGQRQTITSKFTAVESEMTAVHQGLDRVGIELRRLRDDVFNSFREFEDTLNDKHKECLKMSSPAFQPQDKQGHHIKEVVSDGLFKEIKASLEELVERTNQKFDKVLESLT